MTCAITIKEAKEQTMIPTQMNCPHDANGWCLKCVAELAGKIPSDTWTSGKILPTPENDRLIADQFLAIRKDRESVTIEWFWFDGFNWLDENDQEIQVSAWRRIPMDGIDAAVAEGDAQ